MNLLTEHVLVMGSVLFAAGMVGFLTRRSLILMFLSLELMLAGVSVNLVAFSRHHDNYQGQVFAILVLTVAACEAALALALIVALYRQKPTLDVKAWRQLNEIPADEQPDFSDTPAPEDPLPSPAERLVPAGLDPLTQPSPDRLSPLPLSKEVSIHG
jgi:NADH-quinone oxidoreductase subunit K